MLKTSFCLRKYYFSENGNNFLQTSVLMPKIKPVSFMDEKEQHFRKEVNWCIEQLRMGIFNKNPTQKQVKESDRVIKILVSTTAPLVKKRQAMRQMFGDYRKKIELEEKAWIKETGKELEKATIFSVDDKSHSSSKSAFYRESTKIINNKVTKEFVHKSSKILKENEDEKNSNSNVLPLSYSFKFNFSIS